MTAIGLNASLAAESAQYGYQGGTATHPKSPSWKLGERVTVDGVSGLEVIDRCGGEWFLMKTGTDKCFTYNVKRGLRRL